MRWIAPLVISILILMLVGRAPAQIVISEFQAANTFTLKDEEGQSEDWIEIHNLSDTTVNLEGWSLSDEPGKLDKWTFPATNLGPNRFLIIFSSGKDRRIQGRPLHTNFKLNEDGEYLALVKPDGKTIVPGWNPRYPPQLEDVSYGLPVQAETNRFLEPGASGHFLMPASEELGTRWTGLDYDATSWIPIRSGVGFEGGGFSGLTTLLGSDVGGWMIGVNASAYLRYDFIVTNLAHLDELKLTMRYNDGFMAYLNGTPIAWRHCPVAATGGRLAHSLEDWSVKGEQGYNHWYYGYYDREADTDLVYKPETDFNQSDAHWQWNGGAWVLGPSNPPWDLIAMNNWQPNGSNSGGRHWAIRRWISETDGIITCHLAVARKNPSLGTGATLRVLHNGIQRYSAILPANDAAGISTNLWLTDLRQGDFLDFALDPRGSDGSDSDLGDACTFLAVIEQAPADGPAWNSAATKVRSLQESIQAEEIDLTSFKSHLVAGKNVLAIHVMNASQEDSSLLALPELSGTFLTLNTNGGVYFPHPTPGEANGPGSTTIGPLVSLVGHIPLEPADADNLVVHARITPTRQPVKSVSLTYRVMFGPSLEVAMHDNGINDDLAAGDGIYTGRIPATGANPGQMIRYLIRAIDQEDHETKLPSYADPKRSPQYYGTVISDPALSNSRLPVLHWFLQSPSAANSDVPARCSLFYRGGFYDNIGATLHGQSTRGFPKKSYDLNFNPGSHFRWSEAHPKVDKLHLLTTWADKSYIRNVLAHRTYRDAGAPSHFAFPARLQQNGAFFSVVNVVESGDEYFLERLGLDPKGALYKMYNSAESVGNIEKKTRQQEGTADLQALITGLSQPNPASRQAYLFDHLDVPEIVNFLAAKIITADTDCCHKNYYLYRDSEGSGEWQAMPWDVDLSFGRVWTCQTPCLSYFDPVLYTNQSLFIGAGNTVFSRIYETSTTRQMFLRRLRTLMDSQLQPPGTPPSHDLYRFKILGLRDQVAPDAALDLARWGTWGARETITQAVDRIFNEFFPGRRSYLFERLTVTHRGEIPLAQSANATVHFHQLDYRPSSGNPREEWLSLTNGNDFAVDITHWKLAGGVEFIFKAGTVIPKHSVLFVSPDVKAFRARQLSPKGGQQRLVVGNYDGNLSAWGDSLSLFDSAGRLVSSNRYAGAPSPSQKHLRVTEIFYNPDPLAGSAGLDAQQFEYLELCNTGPETLNLGGVRFVEGIHFDFSTGSIAQLEPGARLLLVRDSNAFALRYGTGWPIAGQFSGRLDNGGERLRLEDADGETILDFSYNNSWNPATDGQGSSLAVHVPTELWSAWGNQANWKAATPLVYGRGTPEFNQCTMHRAGAGYRLRYTGTIGRIGMIQKSEDLIDWDILWRAPIPGHGVLEYLEGNPANRTTYYRVIQE